MLHFTKKVTIAKKIHSNHYDYLNIEIFHNLPLLKLIIIYLLHSSIVQSIIIIKLKLFYKIVAPMYCDVRLCPYECRMLNYKCRIMNCEG